MSRTFFLSILFFVSIVISTSCKQQPSSVSEEAYDFISVDSLPYDLFSIDTTDVACKNKQNCANAKLSYPVFITPDSSLNVFLNREVIKSVLYDLDSSAYTSVNNYLKNFFNENDEYGSDDESTGWKNDRTVSVYAKIGKHITLENYNESYKGGVHPNSSEIYSVYDLAAMKQLKASELLNLNDTTLLRIGEFYFRKDNIVADTSSLADANYFIFGDAVDFEDGPNYGRFHFNNNFALTKDGVKFQYNSYEIGPYAVGPSSVTIPYNDIQQFLKLKIW